MGFEVIFHYHERIDGKYNTEEKKALKKKIGDPYSESDHQKLALIVLGQLARRDIWVVDVEIYEFTKKKLSFKEVENGVKINNRKYKITDSVTVSVENDEEIKQVVANNNIVPSTNIATNTNVVVHPHELLQPKRNRPIKTVIYEPNYKQIEEIKRKGLKLTPGKAYAVFEENKIDEFSKTYKIKDDNGRDIDRISEEYFVPQQNLAFDSELEFSKQKNDQPVNLLWGDSDSSQEYGEMVDIRKR